MRSNEVFFLSKEWIIRSKKKRSHQGNKGWCQIYIIQGYDREFKGYDRELKGTNIHIQGVFFTGPPNFQYQKENRCSTNEDLLDIENFMEQNL